MENKSKEIIYECGLFTAYKDGSYTRPRWPPLYYPPCDDPTTGVRSKDVTIPADPKVVARVFLPPTPDPTLKFPVVLYIHGGFTMHTALGAPYDPHAKQIAAGANAIVVSVEYRLAPEDPIPACHEDSWATLQWIAAHSTRSGTDKWLNDHADFDRVFVGGDSGGGNISHTLAYRVGTIGLLGIRLVGMFLVHPFFGGLESDNVMWSYLCPTSEGPDDPMLNPSVEDLGKIGCERVLVFVAGRDVLKQAGVAYYEKLKRSVWKGHVELVEHDERHCFHFSQRPKPDAQVLMQKVFSFIKQE